MARPISLLTASRPPPTRSSRSREKAGWQCYDCNRGPFHVIEVWVENNTMVEILPPEYAAEYLAFTNRDKIVASMAAGGASAARHARQPA